MIDNPHFRKVASWEDARAWLSFTPRQPAHAAGRELQSLSVFVRDHRLRELAAADRSLEAHYGDFVISQSSPGPAEARRRALEVSYGADPRELRIGGHPGRRYELGSQLPAEDPEGPSPAVIVWHDDAALLLVASDTLEASELVDIAQSMYQPDPAGRQDLKPV